MIGLLDKFKSLFNGNKGQNTPKRELPNDTFKCVKFSEKRFNFVTNTYAHGTQLCRALKKINKVEYKLNDENFDYTFIQSKNERDDMINVYDYGFKNIPTNSYIFVEFKKENVKKIVEEIKVNKWNLIGFSSSKSIHDGKGGNVFRILIQRKLLENNVNEIDLMNKMKSGKMNFEDLLFVFHQFKNLEGLPIPGLNITPEIKKLIRDLTVVIQAMNKKERIKCVISERRKEKMTKNGIRIEMIERLLQMMKMLKEKSGDFSSLLGNPQKMMDMLKK
jgi:hypothetical protein